MNYILHILILLEIYVLLAISTNIKAGFTGLLTFSQAAFYGIGAYACTLCMLKWNFPFVISLLAAVSVNLCISLIVFAFSVRLRNLYFSLATLAFQIIIYSIFYNWVSVTNGPYGISGIPRPSILIFPLQSSFNFALFGGLITILTVAAIWYLQNTPLFRQLKCVRDNELGLIASGRNPSYYKLIGILISAAISAIAGSLYAVYFSYIDPSSFTLNESILLLSIVLIGGAGNLIGPITGAIFYVLLPEVLNFISFPNSMAANFRMMIYALILILIIRFKPNGFFGEIKY